MERRMLVALGGALLACGLALGADAPEGEAAKPPVVARIERQLHAAEQYLAQLAEQLEAAIEPELKKITEEMIALQKQVVERTKALVAEMATGATREGLREAQRALADIQGKVNSLKIRQQLLLEVQRLRQVAAEAADNPQVATGTYELCADSPVALRLKGELVEMSEDGQHWQPHAGVVRGDGVEVQLDPSPRAAGILFARVK